jgi:hypothetical protein
MLTVFHLFELVGPAIGVAIGIDVGHNWLGWIGGTVGAVVGVVLGCVVGRVPFVITMALLKRDLQRCDSATLRSRLESQYYIGDLIIAHLVIRGEPIESFRSYVSGLRSSHSADRRRFGERILRIWPETVEPFGSSDRPTLVKEAEK